MRTLKSYLKERCIELSVKKSKVMIFGEARGRKIRQRKHWWWGNEEIEEVKTFGYLGYVFNKANNASDHIKERMRKAQAVLGRIWSIGERYLRNSWKLRYRAYNAVVTSVLLYESELYGWDKDCKKIDMIQLKFVKWTLGLKRATPGCLIRAETGIGKAAGKQ